VTDRERERGNKLESKRDAENQGNERQ